MGSYLCRATRIAKTVSRRGPAFVESESELFADIDRKQSHGDISTKTAEAFIELYEFAKEIGDDVSIGEAKNANFQVRVDAHLGDYQNNPSVFTANVNGDLKIWPARMIMDNAPDFSVVEWDEEDYYEFERAFQSLKGVSPDTTTVQFETIGSDGDVDEFKAIVEEFVSTCREKAK
ncbi:hypothetical protein [Halorubrum salsamenti]|uniref:hypothetical protein n=1 Tax=Halorubrum salsamenti TaxID=2583990 RepID=UPI0011A1997D|nr:hypothetical protein [Halorubrum salsamenti]